MSKFNLKKQNQEKTINIAGGEAYTMDVNSQLASIILTSFAGDQYYRSGDQTINTIKDLLKKSDIEFICKSTVFARIQIGMRSITHVVASELSSYVSGKQWAKEFYSNIINRPDDISEIIAYHKLQGYKITNAMKKGFAMALNRFSEYQLAKYKMENKSIKLVDILNLIHPKPTNKTSESFKKLTKGELKSFDTWESELVEATQGGIEDSDMAKSEVWIKLIREKKLGYMALLKNLRNIIELAPLEIDTVCEMLINQESITKSLVLPFRFYTAYTIIENLLPTENTKKILIALNKAIELSINNIDNFEGKTLVALDVSGSMNNNNDQKSPHITGALLMSSLNKKNNVDSMLFAETAQYCNIPQQDSLMSVAKLIIREGDKGGTNFVSIFQCLNKSYDRIIILSDMQGWMEHGVNSAYNQYKIKFSCDPYIYFFDLQGYGTLQLPQNKIFLLAGFSDKILSIIPFLEKGKNGLYNYINSMFE